jgi:glycosyltransferase involved in cell wall biosynthesis
MRVLQLGKAFPPIKNLGGVEKVMEYFYFGLNKKGVKCDVLGVNDKFEFQIDNFSSEGLIFRERLILKAMSTFLSIHLIKRLYNIWNNYDIIHVHFPDPMSLLAIFLVRPKSKIIIHWHSDILRQKLLYFFIKPLERWALSRANLILCTTPEYYKQNPILSPYLNKTKYLIIGIDKNTIPINYSLLDNLTNRFISKRKIIFIGRLVYYKGIEYLIKSLPLIKTDFILYIVGEGKLENSMKLLVKDIGCEDKVFFLGNINEEDKFTYLYNSDILVLPSIYRTEAYGIVQIEAMALGVPVISTNILGSGVHWVNQHGLSGIIVTCKDSLSIAQAVDNLFSSQNTYNRFVKGAFNRYESVFTSELMLKGLIDHYNSVLNL